jgi:hypothetical protein
VLSLLGSELHLPDSLLYTVNGIGVGYEIPYTFVPETTLRIALGRYQKLGESRAAGQPCVALYVAHGRKVEVLFFYDHATLRVTE